MVDRKDWAGWLEGPRKSLESQGIELGYPGERLGLPQEGPGSIARFGRRIAALLVDWFSALLIATAISNVSTLRVELNVLTLIVFLGHTAFFIAIFGSSFGHKLFRIEVKSLSGKRINLLQSVARQLMICLVVPAVIYDRDQRGLHDKALKLVATRV